MYFEDLDSASLILDFPLCKIGLVWFNPDPIIQLSKYWQLMIILKSCYGLRIKYNVLTAYDIFSQVFQHHSNTKMCLISSRIKDVLKDMP